MIVVVTRNVWQSAVRLLGKYVDPLICSGLVQRFCLLYNTVIHPLTLNWCQTIDAGVKQTCYERRWLASSLEEVSVELIVFLHHPPPLSDDMASSNGWGGRKIPCPASTMPGKDVCRVSETVCAVISLLTNCQKCFEKHFRNSFANIYVLRRKSVEKPTTLRLCSEHES